MTATALAPPRFVRRTQLGANEYRKNFRQVDADIIAAITSAEADRITPLMSKIYLRLASAPPEFWEREGVLYIAAGDEGGQPVKASKVLYGLLGVASATAHKALRWMHDEGVIGYYAGKNGAGIRIFLNRAVGSIGVREGSAGKKILPFARSSGDSVRGSTAEPAFNDSFAVSDNVSDIDSFPRAPQNGAPDKKTADKKESHPRPTTAKDSRTSSENRETTPDCSHTNPTILIDEIVRRILYEIKPVVEDAARRAAHSEHERTREWLERRGLPKAARVAQHEAYSVLRKYGVISESPRGSRAHADAGRSSYTPPAPHPLTQDEVAELAQACVAMLEAKGQSIDFTLSEMSVEAGGFLLPEDAPRVREKANSLISADGRGGN